MVFGSRQNEIDPLQINIFWFYTTHSDSETMLLKKVSDESLSSTGTYFYSTKEVLKG